MTVLNDLISNSKTIDFKGEGLHRAAVRQIRLLGDKDYPPGMMPDTDNPDPTLPARAAIVLLGQTHGVDDALRALAHEAQAHEGQ